MVVDNEDVRLFEARGYTIREGDIIVVESFDVGQRGQPFRYLITAIEQDTIRVINLNFNHRRDISQSMKLMTKGVIQRVVAVERSTW